MKTFKQIKEASYIGNLGFEEMVNFYRKATKEEEEKMEKIIKRDDYEAFKKLIAKVLSVDLKESLNRPYPWKLYEHDKSESIPIEKFLYGFKSENDAISVIIVDEKGNSSLGFKGAEGWSKSGQGDSFRVFATILDILNFHLNKYEPESLFFTSEKDAGEIGKDSRTSLYKKLARKYTPENYDLNIRTDAAGRERAVTYFRFTRKD